MNDQLDDQRGKTFMITGGNAGLGDEATGEGLWELSEELLGITFEITAP